MKLGQEGSISSAKVIAAVRSSHPDVVSAASEDLQNMAMHRIFSRLAAKTPKDDRQAQLLADYPGVHQTITIDRVGEKAPDWKLLLKATLREVDAWLRNDRRSSAKKRVREPATAKMLRDLSAVAKGNLDMTVEAALKLKAAETKKKP